MTYNSPYCTLAREPSWKLRKPVQIRWRVKAAMFYPLILLQAVLKDRT